MLTHDVASDASVQVESERELPGVQGQPTGRYVVVMLRRGNQSQRSHLYLFPNGAQHVKVRITYPAGRYTDEAVQAFISELFATLPKPAQTTTSKGSRIMSIKNALASVAVKDLGSAVQWYQRLFGRPPDSRQASGVAEWKFEQGGWLQVYANPERAGHGSFTLAVASLDEQIAELRKRGIDTGGQMIGENARVVMIKDQDGNSIAFAETTEQSVDQ